MDNLIGELKNNDGSIEVLQIISNDTYSSPLNTNKTYKLANRIQNKENKIVSTFKNSIFGSEIGIKAEGFSNIVILSTILAIGSLIIMYILWRI